MIAPTDGVCGDQALVLSPSAPILSAMDDPSNFIDDFPATTFTILAFCAACGHQAPLERTKIPPGITIQALRYRLRRSACGSRETSLCILYTGAGRFRYGAGNRCGDPRIVDG